MTPADSNFSPAATHLESLRGQVMAALLTKKRGEARHLLGQLVALSEDPDAIENLNALVGGVATEVATYESSTGSIHERLISDTPPEEIQAELDFKISYWRAFVGDITALSMAKNGVADRENPFLKEKISEVTTHLKSAKISDALELWRKLGEPVASADGILVQILELLAQIQSELAAGKLHLAHKTLENLRRFSDGSQAANYGPGLGVYVGKVARILRYEVLLERANAPTIKKERVKRALLEETMAAKGEVESLSLSDSTLLPFKERLDEAINMLSGVLDLGSDRPPWSKSPMVLQIGFLAVIGVLCLGWFVFYSINTGSHDSAESGLQPLPVSISACGGKPSPGDVSLPMPNGYTMLFRKIHIPESAGQHYVKIKEHDQSDSLVRAPFNDESGQRYLLMGKTEVTVGQFSQFMKIGNSRADDSALPVRFVTVEETQDFCKAYSIWLSSHANLPKSDRGKFGQIRLPSSGEWEFAARGGVVTHGSAKWSDRFAAYGSGNVAQFEWFAGPQSSQGKVRKVGILGQSLLGLVDMLGNVSEITCNDSSGHKEYWMRGGNISVSESNLTPARKSAIPPMMPSGIGPFRQEELGFRVVISVPRDWNEN